MLNHLPEHVVSLCVSSFSRPRILVMEKSVSFRGRRIGAKDVLWKRELGDNSSDFLECIESTDLE